MAGFCVQCGLSQMAPGVKFCAKCGAAAAGGVPGRRTPVPAPVSAPPSAAPAAPAAPAAGTGGSSTVLKVILIVVAIVVFLMLLHRYGSCVYIAYRVKKKAHEFTQQMNENAPAYTGSRDPCAMLSTSEAGRILGEPVSSAEAVGSTCQYHWGAGGNPHPGD